MAVIQPQSLYEEFQADPSGLGYAIGNGVSFNDKVAEINLVRDTITVTLISIDADTVDPGEYKGTLPLQMIRDAIDNGEYDANCLPSAGEGLRDKILALWSGPGDTPFSFTDGAIAQILGTFTNPDWAITRAAIIGLRQQPGSRAAELFGQPDAPVSRNDMLAAEQYATDNALTSLYE